MPQPLAREYSARLMQQPLAIHLSPAGGIVVVPFTALDISATAIRDMLLRGRKPAVFAPRRGSRLYSNQPLYESR